LTEIINTKGNPIVTVLDVGDLGPTKKRPFAIWSIVKGVEIEKKEGGSGRITQFLEKQGRLKWGVLERRHFFGMVDLKGVIWCSPSKCVKRSFADAL
jgi:hypothetical protein